MNGAQARLQCGGQDLGSRTGSKTPQQRRKVLSITSLWDTAYIHESWLRRTRGNNERENWEDYWGDSALSKPGLERFLPQHKRDQITSSLDRMVQSRIQQCRLHINYMVIRSREPASTHSALNRGRRGGRRDRPHASPSPFLNFQRLFLHFLKPADLKF